MRLFKVAFFLFEVHTLLGTIPHFRIRCRYALVHPCRYRQIRRFKVAQRNPSLHIWFSAHGLFTFNYETAFCDRSRICSSAVLTAYFRHIF